MISINLLNFLENKLKIYANTININIDKLSILLAFSGGSDSMALFISLYELNKKYKFNLALAHINHNMHKYSNDYKQFCIDIANKYKIPIYLKELNFNTSNNLESKSRKARYEFLNNISKKYVYNLILTGHHKNDQVETILMKVIDGSDWISKIGIREEFNNIRRPFIDISKNNLLKFLHDKNIEWKEDPTNFDLTFKRNKVRKVILPNMQLNNPNIDNELLEKQKDCRIKMIKALLKIDKYLSSLIKEENKLYIEFYCKILRKFTIEEIKILIYKLVLNKNNITLKDKTRGFWKEFLSFNNYSRTGSSFRMNNILFFSILLI